MYIDERAYSGSLWGHVPLGAFIQHKGTAEWTAAFSCTLLTVHPGNASKVIKTESLKMC